MGSFKTSKTNVLGFLIDCDVVVLGGIENTLLHITAAYRKAEDNTAWDSPLSKWPRERTAAPGSWETGAYESPVPWQERRGQAVSRATSPIKISPLRLSHAERSTKNMIGPAVKQPK